MQIAHELIYQRNRHNDLGRPAIRGASRFSPRASAIEWPSATFRMETADWIA
jgi:hypothetical protein